MKAIVNGKILLPDRVETEKALLYGEQIEGLVPAGEIEDAEVIDAGGRYVSPGFIDLHIHGYLGEDASDGSAEGIRKMARGIAANGVTSFFPTTMTVESGHLERVFDLFRALRQESREASWTGAEILGVNAEGPFINPRKKGAQAEEHILPPSEAFIRKNADIIRLFTLAPEMPGGMKSIRGLTRDTDVLVSIGHTGATYDQAMEAIEAGAGHVTHLFNAMTPLNHREPGVVGAALGTGVSVELIADTFHVHPALFSWLAKVKGEQLILVTDCTRAGGLPDGEYTLGGQPIFVRGIECRLADGTIAGSVLKMNEAVRNLWRHTALPLHEIVNMASLYPARRTGMRHKGSLEQGRDADIVLFSSDLEIDTTIIRGRVHFKRDA